MENANINALIIVCCHAIWTGSGHTECPDQFTPTYSAQVTQPSCLHDDFNDESQWAIKPFQRGETGTFVRHIRVGMDILESAMSGQLASDEAPKEMSGVQITWLESRPETHGQILNPILCFSGGRTEQQRTNTSEAESYLHIAKKLLSNSVSEESLSTSTAEKMHQRMFMDNWATDSMQNILLSLLQYSHWKITLSVSTGGSDNQLKLPEYVLIVSHDFKKSRFLDQHLAAIQRLWPCLDMFDPWSTIKAQAFFGVDPQFDEQKRAEVVQGDLLKGYGAWQRDTFGTGPELSSKRVSRGWDEGEFLQFISSGLTKSSTKQAILQMLKGIPR